MELFGIDTIGWILVVMAFGIFIILGVVMEQFYILKGRYCSYCGTVRTLKARNNVVIRKMMKYRSVCGNTSCESHQIPPLSEKFLNAGVILIGIWLPFYVFLFRSSVIIETTTDVFYTDLMTGGFLVLIFYAVWRFYSQKIQELHPIEGL